MVIYDIPWYLLTPSDQKMFMVALQHSQSSKRLYILGERTLNVETGVAVIITNFLNLLELPNCLQ